MDANNWRAQAQGGGEGGEEAAGALSSDDWRTQLFPDSRQRIFNKILETLKQHLPVSEQEEVEELKKIVVSFEEKVYSASTSQRDYLRKISLEMVTMETKSQNPMTNSIQPNLASSGQNALGPGEFTEFRCGIEMDGNNWKAQVQGGGKGGRVAAGALNFDDWRTQPFPDSRQKIVYKIMETLKQHLPVSEHEGVQELKKIAVSFEEKVYSAATSQQDYLRKISLKMLTMERKYQNSASSGQNALSPGGQ